MFLTEPLGGFKQFWSSDDVYKRGLCLDLVVSYTLFSSIGGEAWDKPCVEHLHKLIYPHYIYLEYRTHMWCIPIVCINK